MVAHTAARMVISLWQRSARLPHALKGQCHDINLCQRTRLAGLAFQKGRPFHESNILHRFLRNRSKLVGNNLRLLTV
jgi:hypothetical protein